MAKGNLFLGQAKGKVGSVVFSRAFGQQITRSKPTSVANPRTTAQNVQRAILATVAKEAALMTPIVDHSFANVAYGAASVRYFRKVNLGILRNRYNGVSENMNLSAKGANAVPNALKISEGSLPAFDSVYQNSAITFYQAGALEDIAEVTVEQFRAAYPYLQGGDQLTLVKWVKTGGSLENSDATFALKVDRMVFAPNAFDDPSSEMINDEYFINSSKLDLTKTTNAEMLTALTGGSGNGLGVNTSSDNCYAAALILSRKVNNVWQRSTQYLVITNIDDWVDSYSAVESYGNTSSLSAPTEYLNQADEGTQASGVSGAYMGMSVKAGSDDAITVDVNAGDTEQQTITKASGTVVAIGAQAFAPTGTRIVTVEIDRPDGSYAAHGSSSLNYNVAITAETAGKWTITSLFSDGTSAVYELTLAVQA